MKINLRCTAETRLTPHQLEQILLGLAAKKEVRELSLISAPLNKIAFAALIKCIQESPLTRLDLTGTSLDILSQKSLIEVLKENPDIQFFHWDHGEISLDKLRRNLKDAAPKRSKSITFTPYLDLAVKPEFKKKKDDLDYLGIDINLPVLRRSNKV